jgi:hypothetical protein
MGVQAFGAELAAKAFDEADVGRLARPREWSAVEVRPTLPKFIQTMPRMNANELLEPRIPVTA